MAWSVILHSDAWSDLSLEELAQKAGDWGYQGLELACGSDHLEIQRALSEEGYCQKSGQLLARYELQAGVLSARGIGQAVGDEIQPYHQGLVPDYVWGDGDKEGVQQALRRKCWQRFASRKSWESA